jgi:transcription-repair coupling factor (superfamily II helicase)
VGSYPSASLTLRSIVKTAATGAGLTPAQGRVSGLTPAAQALFVTHALRDDVAVVVVATDSDVDRFTADARFFLAALEGLSDAEVERAVLTCPSLEVDPYRGLSPHFDVASARARALHALAAGSARLVVVSAAGLLPRLSAPARLLAASVAVVPGDDLSPVALGDLLAEGGFTREDPVDQHGEYCVRGGVVDFFPAGDAHPVRLEFVGDTVESIRRYDPATQRSIETLDRAAVLPLREAFDLEDRPATFLDYAHATRAPRFFVAEPSDIRAQAEKTLAQIEAAFADASGRGERVRSPGDLVVGWPEIESWLTQATTIEELAVESPVPSPQSLVIHVGSQPAVEFRGRIADWVAEVRHAREQGETVVVAAATPGRAERTVELLGDYEVRAVLIDRADDLQHAPVLVTTGRLSRGFRLPAARFQIYAETDVFDEERRVHERRRAAARTFLSDFRDLGIGDHVVHVDHGIGMFVGLKRLTVGQEAQEFMELRYDGDDKLFVPVERLDLVQKYTGGARPSLDRLGGTTWERAKTRVRKAMRDMAEELLKLYASRQAVKGHAFASDTHWQQEFEDAFEYELTPDQVAAIAEIKRDMETPAPMDRLLCGDVGYGKTEVAMRAAFKAVMDGRQVAFLAPTTVLAFQHQKTLRDRFQGFPVQIEMVSRFRSKAEQQQVVAALAAGRVDIIVGTHRLLSKDVEFRDLGLLVVDEEQRFGVAHKERIKQLRKKVDVLTMTATPIPRTLNMSLAGIRDMSVIETPPRDRLAIQTNVVKFDQPVIARAIRTELARGGQVFFVHNRVESIYSLGALLQRLVPEARVAVAHGQMSEHALEKAMVDFVAHEYDVLLATTIVENGLDIPNANTLIVNRADRYGLAQLYQLRGRVGRSDRRAYAYLLIPPEDSLSPVARKRLAAIREFSDLGSGFRVAALDLEIRGAGNLLGGEQSGHIDAVGFDMYMKLLEQSVRELKGEAIEDERGAAVNLRVDLRIDERYIPDMNQRLTVYRRMAAVRNDDDLVRMLEEVHDRYGPPPVSILNLADYARIRLLATRLGLESIDREGALVVLKFRLDAPLDPTFLISLVQARRDVTLVPPAVVKLDLRATAAAKPRSRQEARPPRAPDRIRRPADRTEPSWWTSRATAGEVTAGFSKEEILRPPTEDPRSEGGVFARVRDLLDELSRGHGIG